MACPASAPAAAPRVVMFTVDQQIDRRILLEADVLEAEGWHVQIVALGRDGGPPDDRRVQRLAASSGEAGPVRDRVVLGARRWVRRALPLNSRWMRRLRALGWRLMLSSPGPFFCRLFGDAIRDKPAEVYVAHDLPMLPVAVEAARVHGGRVVYDSHELFAEQEFGRAERRMWAALEGAHIQRCDAVVTVNPSIARELERRHALTRVHVVHNAERCPAAPPKRRPLFQEYFGLPEQARILLFQGGLAAGRNLDVLVQAMTLIEADDIHLVFLGDGAMREPLRRLAQHVGVEHRVHFHPAVPQGRLIEYSAAADIGVIPYQATCLNNLYCTPNKLFEFLAAGLPMVASDLPELRRLVLETGVGLVGDTRTPAGLAQLVNCIVAKSETLARHKAAVTAVRQELCWENEGRRFAAIFRELS